MAKKKPKKVDLSCRVGEIKINQTGHTEAELDVEGNIASVLVVGMSVALWALNRLDRGEQLPLAMQCIGQLQQFAGINGDDDPEDVVNSHLVQLKTALRKVKPENLKADVKDCCEVIQSVLEEEEKNDA